MASLPEDSVTMYKLSFRSKYAGHFLLLGFVLLTLTIFMRNKDENPDQMNRKFFSNCDLHFAHWEEQRHNSKFDKMDLSILVKSPFHSAYFSKSVKTVSSNLTREREKKS